MKKPIVILKRIIKSIIKKSIKNNIKEVFQNSSRKRYSNFIEFDKLIKYSKAYIYKDKIHKSVNYDYYIVGSDQVWNTTFHTFSRFYLLEGINEKNKISYSSSFGTADLSSEYKPLFKNNLQHFKYISVREDSGKRIIDKLTKRNDVEVLIDPTMLLTAKEWDKVEKRPEQLNAFKNEKYILNYFLGNLSEARKKEIEKVAKEYDCHIINLLDKNDMFYTCGPSEFLYLEKHAFLICTDSFHSSVFALLYNRPFIVFEREDNFKNMSSRLDTLINKFNLKNRKYNNKCITIENLNHDYSESYKILEIERKKSKEFLIKALDIKESD